MQQDSPPAADPLERENIRAHLAVAMQREPANAAPRWSYPIWRLNAGSAEASPGSSSRFEMEMRTTPRVLGVGFAFLLSATVGFLLWHQLFPGPARTGTPLRATAPLPDAASDEEPAAPAAAVRAPSEAPGGVDLSAFAGVLRAGVDPSWTLEEGQGVLELVGSSELSVEVDGVDRGPLPVALVLDQGTHRVRYRVDARSTDRFYYVKSGATRAATAPIRAGGLVDPR